MKGFSQFQIKHVLLTLPFNVMFVIWTAFPTTWERIEDNVRVFSTGYSLPLIKGSTQFCLPHIVNIFFQIFWHYVFPQLLPQLLPLLCGQRRVPNMFDGESQHSNCYYEKLEDICASQDMNLNYKRGIASNPSINKSYVTTLCSYLIL